MICEIYSRKLFLKNPVLGPSSLLILVHSLSLHFNHTAFFPMIEHSMLITQNLNLVFLLPGVLLLWLFQCPGLLVISFSAPLLLLRITFHSHHLCFIALIVLGNDFCKFICSLPYFIPITEVYGL